MKTLGLKYVDIILQNDRADTSCLYSPQRAFSPRTATLKLPSVLLKHRRTKTQRYFLTLQTGPAMLDDPREMIRKGQYLWFARMASR